MVRLTRIYTRFGDDGTTRLGDMSEVSKADARVAAYGDVDELNCLIGVARSAGLPDEPDRVLARVQNELFDLGADLCVPGTGNDRIRIESEHTRALERDCDAANEPLEPLDSFVLPGGCVAAAALHHSRAVCRRAERSVVHLIERDSGRVNAEALRYLNRLSDLLFILARRANGDAGAGDVLWRPAGGGKRGASQ